MKQDDIDFIKEYRRTNDGLTGTERPPCLDCTDAVILACSKVNPSDKTGCSLFKTYVNQ
jgi:hypothetical protein